MAEPAPSLDRHVIQTPGVRGGKPCLAGTRISVSDVVLLHNRLGWSLEEIAGSYELDLAAIHAAMSYYFDHRQEIDDSIDAEVEYADSLREATPSPLRRKLNGRRLE